MPKVLSVVRSGGIWYNKNQPEESSVTVRRDEWLQAFCYDISFAKIHGKETCFDMKINEGMFAVKLYELERQYGRMQSRLRLCQQDDHQKIRQELQRVMEEYQEDELLLNNVENSRSPAVAALAGAQLDYSRRAEEILEQELPEYLRDEDGSAPEEGAKHQAEAAALYAEYAIDFAVQSMRYALMTALKAMDMQMDSEEAKTE